MPSPRISGEEELRRELRQYWTAFVEPGESEANEGESPRKVRKGVRPQEEMK
jgi:hypothetical protein